MAIGKLFHLIHMTGDLPSLEAWYDDVFSVRRGFLDHNYTDTEKRDASLVVLGDAVIEPLAPAFRVEGWDVMPLGRFYNRFGNHWHSIAFYTDDAGEIWQRCTDNNIRCYVTGGVSSDQRPPAAAPVFTHPKDTVTQLEFMRLEGSVLETKDPRVLRDWDPDWWVNNHPLGVERLAYTTVITRDLDRAVHVYVDVLGGQMLGRNESELTGTRNAYVLMGETVVELANPTRDGTLAADDMAANGEIHHAAAFKVRDLAAAGEYLAAKGIKTVDRDEHTILSDPSTTHGAAFRWTDVAAPGDPRG